MWYDQYDHSQLYCLVGHDRPYYVDDHFQRQYVWVAPWHENPS